MKAWNKYPESKPTQYGKYEVFRESCKKQHYETWNNTGWAYNNKDISHWREIESPLEEEDSIKRQLANIII